MSICMLNIINLVAFELSFMGVWCAQDIRKYEKYGQGMELSEESEI